MHDPDDIPTPPSDDDHEALAREHAARVEAARLHHAAEAQLPVPGALAASLDGLLAGLRVAVVDPVHEARVQAERRAREARERRTLRALADARDIPADELLRAVALDPCPSRPAPAGRSPRCCGCGGSGCLCSRSTISASRRVTPRWCRGCCSRGGMRAS